MAELLETENELTRTVTHLTDAQPEPVAINFKPCCESNRVFENTDLDAASETETDRESIPQQSVEENQTYPHPATPKAMIEDVAEIKDQLVTPETPDIHSRFNEPPDMDGGIAVSGEKCAPQLPDTDKQADSEVSDTIPKDILETPDESPENTQESTDINTVALPAANLESLSHTMDTFCQQIAERLDSLDKLFRHRLIYDETKETQIRELHAELQVHKKGLLDAALKPYIKSLIRMHDNMGRALVDIEVQIAGNDEGIRVDQIAEIFKGFRDELELILDQNGIETFITNEDRFDPRQQQALRRVTVDDVSLRGQIAERIRAGFRRGDVIIQKERVAVYV